MSDVELRRFAVVAERAAGCRCRPGVTEVLVGTEKGPTTVVAVIHEARCPRWLPDDEYLCHPVAGLP